MRLFLDTNVWSYCADHDAGDDLASAARRAGTQVVVSPAVVDELRSISNADIRRRALKLVTRSDWTRLMPEVYSECAELKKEIRRLRPEWLLSDPNLAEVHRLRYDWVRRQGGFWDRARDDIAPLQTDEGKRAEMALRLAREQSYDIRKRLIAQKVQAGETHLQRVATVVEEATPGWTGGLVEYWRVPSLYFFRSELFVYASPVREWLDSDVDIAAMVLNPASVNRLWLHEMAADALPRQWLRGALEFLQGWHKVTDGTPTDATLATHLVEADRFLTADKNFARFAQRCRAEAPFRTAATYRVPGGRDGVDATLRLVSPAER